MWLYAFLFWILVTGYVLLVPNALTKDHVPVSNPLVRLFVGIIVPPFLGMLLAGSGIVLRWIGLFLISPVLHVFRATGY